MHTLTAITGKGRQKKTHTIEVFYDPKELPILRRQALHSWLLMDAEIGNDMEAIDRRTSDITMYAAQGKLNETYNAAMNFRFTLFSAIERIDYKTPSFACFVSSINGKQCTDITDAGLKATAKQIAALNLPGSEVDDWFKEVKKKLMPS